MSQRIAAFTVLFDRLTDLRDSNTSLGSSVVSESFSSKNTWFCDVINFEASYLAFLCNSLSI